MKNWESGKHRRFMVDHLCRMGAVLTEAIRMFNGGSGESHKIGFKLLHKVYKDIKPLFAYNNTVDSNEFEQEAQQ